MDGLLDAGSAHLNDSHRSHLLDHTLWITHWVTHFGDTGGQQAGRRKSGSNPSPGLRRSANPFSPPAATGPAAADTGTTGRSQG